jgi:hypothetical protein
MDFNTVIAYSMYAFIVTLIGIGVTTSIQHLATSRISVVAWCLSAGTAISGWTLWFFMHFGRH